MGRVRLHVTVPGGGAIMVPCDHRDFIKDLVALIDSRVDGATIVELQVFFAATACSSLS